MKLKIIFFLFFVIYSQSIFAINIRVVDLQFLINQNQQYLNFLSIIEKDQLIHVQKFNEIELNLQSELRKLDELKLILDDVELQKEIKIYNNLLNQFNINVDKFNIHYQNQTNDLKNTILNKILELLKIFSLDNEIDLILDSNNYILSSNSINITDIIIIELNKINFDINFEKYK